MPSNEVPPHVIPADWYDARPLLRQLYDLARARLVPPDLLLGNALTLVSLGIPNDVALPPTIGGPTALNFGSVMVAETGVGKSTTRRLLTSVTRDERGVYAPEHVLALLPQNAEGLVEALLGDEEDDTGHRLPHGLPMLVYCDEGRTLDSYTSRNGSTIVAGLLSGISGDEIGQTNATKGLKRRVPALSYRMAVSLSTQPKYLAGVLADVDGGLPQRFWFVAGSGHHLDNESHDEPRLPIVFPTLREEFGESCGGLRVLSIPNSVLQEVRDVHLARLHSADRGEPVAGSSHRMLLRLRLGALLAVLDGRPEMNLEDWQLAGVLVGTSDATVRRGDALRAQEARERARADRDRVVDHAVSADRAVEHDRTVELAKLIARHVRQSGRAPSRRDLRQHLSKDKRQRLPEAIDYAVGQGWIVERVEGKRTVYQPGAENP